MSMPSRSEILSAAIDLRRFHHLDLTGLPRHKIPAVKAAFELNNSISNRAADILDRVLESMDKPA